MVREYAVFYKHFIARLKGSMVSHVYVNATSEEEALKEAGPHLPKDAEVVQVDIMPEWEVTK